MPKAPENLREFAGLLKVVEFLRGPEGCPWDKEQTHSTLTRYAIEEAFELSEAIDTGEDAEIREELGDVLLQVVLHSEIARQEGRFDIYDVIQGIGEKWCAAIRTFLATRWPKDSAAVLSNWAEIKAAERGRPKGAYGDLVLRYSGWSTVVAAQSQKIGEKTRKVDFDWTDAEHCWPKIREELGELRAAMCGRLSRVEIEVRTWRCFIQRRPIGPPSGNGFRTSFA